MPSAKLLNQQKGNLTKDVIEKKQEQEQRMSDLQKLQIEPPEWLDETAKEEYVRIYPLLQELPIADLDLALVSTYCQTFSNYINATKRLAKESAIVETKQGTKLNQNYTLQRDSLTALNSIAPKLGLSVDSRLKIFAPKEKTVDKKDPFGDMLNG